MPALISATGSGATDGASLPFAAECRAESYGNRGNDGALWKVVFWEWVWGRVRRWAVGTGEGSAALSCAEAAPEDGRVESEYEWCRGGAGV
jgi:hypothetical protein